MRLPRLKPTGRKGPILPNFDIRIGTLRIDRLNIGPGVAGKARSGRVVGSADIRSGRALVDLKVALAGGGDKINLKLDAEPDRDKFDIEARVVSPADGVIPALVGTHRAIGFLATGQGSWTRSTVKGTEPLIKTGSTSGLRHHFTNISVKRTPEGADATCYLLMYTARTVPATLSTTATYQDTLVKTSDGWRFKRRIMWRDDDPLSPFKPPPLKQPSQTQR